MGSVLHEGPSTTVAAAHDKIARAVFCLIPSPRATAPVPPIWFVPSLGTSHTILFVRTCNGERLHATDEPQVVQHRIRGERRAEGHAPVITDVVVLQAASTMPQHGVSSLRPRRRRQAGGCGGLPHCKRYGLDFA